MTPKEISFLSQIGENKVRTFLRQRGGGEGKKNKEPNRTTPQILRA